MLLPEPLLQQYYEDSIKISRESMVNMTVTNGNYSLKSPIGKTKAKVLILAGEKELKIMKKSAAALNKTIPSRMLKLLPGSAHGQFTCLRSPVNHSVPEEVLYRRRLAVRASLVFMGAPAVQRFD